MWRLAVGMVLLTTMAVADVTVTQNGNSTNIETEGNLAATQDAGCIALEQALPTLSPADLALSVRQCAQEARPEDAAELMALMFARGHFDTLRVADETSYQGLKVLQMDLISSLSGGELAKTQKAFTVYGKDPNGPAMVKLCTKMAALGVPQHDPAYMIAHGMNAVMSKNDDPLIAGFNAEAAWAETLHDYMHCPS